MDITDIRDDQAEAGVIATLIYHPEFLMHTDFLKPRFFYNIENQCLFWAIDQMCKAGIENIDALNLTNMINSNGAIKRKMEDYNIKNLQEYIDMSKYASRDTLEEYRLLVKTVMECSYKRDLNKISDDLKMQSFGDADVATINNIIGDKITNLTEKYLTTTEIQTFGEHVDDIWAEIEQRRTANGICGLPSKFPSLNAYFTYESGEMIMIKARMKVGKSALLLNEAIHKIKNGVPTVYFDTEMQDRLFFLRMVANISGVSIMKIKTGIHTEEEGKRIEAAKEFIKKQPFVHIYTPSVNMDEVYSICKILKYKMNLQFVIYDYIKSNEADTAKNYNLLGGIADFLKNRVAGELKLAVLTAAQLNRENNVADSDKLERYCSTSILFRQKTSEEIASDGMKAGNYALQITINRNGSSHDEDEYVSLNFAGDIMRIVEAEEQPRNSTPFGT